MDRILDEAELAGEHDNDRDIDGDVLDNVLYCRLILSNVHVCFHKDLDET
jgi:hypothetical protein